MNKIDQVIETIKNVGWHQGSYYNFDEDNTIIGVCIIGAIRHTAARHNVSPSLFMHKPMAMIRSIINEQYPDRMDPEMAVVPAFNDHKDTTIEDVIAVLEKASIELDEKGDSW
jgi:hypothetical protein